MYLMLMNSGTDLQDVVNWHLILAIDTYRKKLEIIP